MKEIIALIVATILAALFYFGAWNLDRRVLGSDTLFRPIIATALIAISTWIILLIFLSLFLKVPGAYGPVQFWYNEPSDIEFMMGIRVVALFMMVGARWLAWVTGVAAIGSLFFPCSGSRWWRLLVPCLAVCEYVLAYKCFLYYQFYPSA